MSHVQLILLQTSFITSAGGQILLIITALIATDLCTHKTYMGRSAQDGENEQYLSLFFFWSFTVAKRFDFLKFRQLF